MSETSQQEILSVPAAGLSVVRRDDGAGLTLTVGVKTDADCLLHWGLSGPGGAWQRPPEACWPEGTAPADGAAVRTPLAGNGDGKRETAIRLGLPNVWKSLQFVLYFPREKRWLRNDGKDFSLRLPRKAGRVSTPEETLATWAPEADASRESYTFDGGDRLAAAVRRTSEAVRVRMVCDADPPLTLHWGVAPRFRFEWKLPPENCRPAGTSVVDALAGRTPFTERDGLQYLELEFPQPAEGTGPRGMKFVLYQPASSAWLKKGGTDVYLQLFPAAPDPRLASPLLEELAEKIVGAEKGAASWTLMHRFHLCHDLLEQAQDDEEALALLFVWLRYSAIRQLDWQRRYNTQPRDLSHAQDRLTARLAGLWRRRPEPATGVRMWVRLLLTTLGRGGEGQRVRDEILQIMHRNHLKEVSGHFIEEWHQKLHNNTTPDDVVICAAYLAFLRSNGDPAAFYRTLEEGGVTRERLKGFERPIKSDPAFYADRKDALVKEFENFLRILKSVHAGTDLESAAAAARVRVDEGLRNKLDALLGLRHRRPGAAELAAVTSVREGLKGALPAAKDDAAARDLLFLDLALEETVRAAVERQNLGQLNRDGLADLVDRVLRNLSLSVESKELAACADHWSAVLAWPRAGQDWALHAKSVADRAARWVQGFTNILYQRLQPKAEYLGAAFEAQSWTIPLFSEEVIRGGPAFALALLLRPLDPVLRKEAGLGGWQVISPGRASGRVRVAERLKDVQGERFAAATVLIADAVSGDEEIPEGVTAVLTADAPDLVSHLAVRARNAGVLFATCFEPEIYQRLKGLKDKVVSLRATPGGDVVCEEDVGTRGQGAVVGQGDKGTRGQGDKGTRGQGDKEAGKEGNVAAGNSLPLSPCPLVPLSIIAWVVTQDQFAAGVVGGKANNLNGLRGRLPDWIQLPAGLALPFGAFEKALRDDRNRELRAKVEALIAEIDQNPVEGPGRIRARVMEIAEPAGLKESLLEVWPRVGLPPVPWEQVWNGVRRVWASQWNDRAYLSRRARGVPHESLRMAVLVQPVVPADYAYVIHTVNPLTGDPGEIYAEVVLGLGETLVGNYPGRALGFVCRKDELKPRLVSYPGKSLGLYGKGVIFRSDSNGEDLEGFAGAGLYDSFLAEEPEHRVLDYRGEKLVWDAAFRDDLLRSAARVGLEVEKALGAPQDVEGAVAGGKFHVVQTRPQVGLNQG